MAAQADRLPVIAIINTSLETTELLEDLFRDEGFEVVSAYTVEFKRGQRDLLDLFAERRPQVVLYDIALPYEENWAFFREEVLGAGVLPYHCFVVTTTNLRALESLVGPTSAIELIGKPYDLDMIVKAVRSALAS